ncbi:hypothetical protein CRE_23716 [Caenorhabditis remanei]|uniref:NTF2 domain-containing protein n=1 Tax=Caenorhabditis remanei TaxID=31234 RepID=E3NCZ4_CAERE|nr:hypothetical protein CRE_23716 [Caenorhabditis remanei]
MNRKSFGNHRSRGGAHRDVKQLSRNKSRFDFDDEPAVPGNISVLFISLIVDILVSVRTNTNSANNRGREGAQRNPFYRSSASIANTGVRNAALVFKCRAIGAAKKVEAKWLIKQLHQKIENFKPLLWDENNRGDFEWFVRDEDIASTIKMNSRRIFHEETGTRVVLVYTRVPAPWMQLKRSEIEIINVSSIEKSNRYDTFYRELSTSRNRIRHLDYASGLVSIAKFVKELDFSHNHISVEKDLDKFAGLPVETFFFEGNPIVETFTQNASYIRLPRLNILQNQQLYSIISLLFHIIVPLLSSLSICSLNSNLPIQLYSQDVPEMQPDGVEVKPLVTEPEPTEPLVTEPEVNINDAMPFRAGYYPTEQIRVLVEHFVVSFFDLYDGTDGQRNRRNLHNAYDADASVFTLTIKHLSGSQFQRHHNDDCYRQYVQLSHNVLEQQYFAHKRESRQARGAMDIAVALSKLPTTHHMKNTFIVDVFLHTNDLLGFTVQGLFLDGDLTKDPSPSYFSRSFLVSPRENNTVAVLSDQLFISTASSERLEKFKKLIDQAAKNAMTEAMCQFSGMIAAYSEKCLADCGWNYALACAKFTEIRASIPAEAFSQ